MSQKTRLLLRKKSLQQKYELNNLETPKSIKPNPQNEIPKYSHNEKKSQMPRHEITSYITHKVIHARN